MYGLGLSIVSDVLSPLAFVVQKLAHMRDGNIYRSPLWWFGVVLLGVSEIGNGVAYGDHDIPTSSIAAVGAVGIVANAFFARIILKEHMHDLGFVGVGLITLGVVEVVLFTPQRDVHLQTSDILEILGRPVSVGVFGGMGVALAVSFVVARKHPIMWIVCGTTCGALTVVSARVVFLFVNTMVVEGVGAWNWYVVPFVGVLLAFGTLQLVFTNRALANMKANTVIPLTYVGFTLIASVSGSIIYDEVSEGTSSEWVIVANSIVMCMLGIRFVQYKTGA